MSEERTAEQILTALKKQGKITEFDVEQAVGLTRPFQDLTRILVTITGDVHDDSEQFYEEERHVRAWELPAHCRWAALTHSLVSACGSIEEAKTSISKVTAIWKSLKKPEQALMAKLWLHGKGLQITVDWDGRVSKPDEPSV